MDLPACYLSQAQIIKLTGGKIMLQTKTLGRKSGLLACIGICLFLVANLQIANGAESGCITCHMDKEMLKKNITVTEGPKSSMQSGAG
jgi:hypothetical protein